MSQTNANLIQTTGTPLQSIVVSKPNATLEVRVVTMPEVVKSAISASLKQAHQASKKVSK